MYPILFQLGPFTLRTYGLLVAIAFLVGLQAALFGARRRKISESFVLDWSALTLVAGILGARLLYVLLNVEFFREHPADIFKVWEGGLVFYGGFLLAAGAGVGFARRRHQSLAQVSDLAAPALAFGQAIGRLGCFFAGCCYGKPTDRFWAVQFKSPDALAPLGVALHPTQLYESLGTLAIGLVLGYRLMYKKDPPGLLFWGYVLGYGLLRFSIEMLRGDIRGAVWGGMYPSQWIALVAIILAASVLIAQISERTK